MAGVLPATVHPWHHRRAWSAYVRPDWQNGRLPRDLLRAR